MFTDKDLGYILYNNRSVSGVVKNFIDKTINPFDLIKVENQLETSKSKYEKEVRMIQVNKSELNLNTDDIIVKPEDLSGLTEFFKDHIGSFNNDEYLYLMNRGIGEKKIIRYDLLGLSNFKERRDLEIIGASSHPILSEIFDDGIGRGGIIIPLFRDGELQNCAIRRLDASKSLKYSLACPDIPVWGLEGIGEGEEIWLCEGLFDMIALHSLGKLAASCSSAMWSGIQLLKVLKLKPKAINIFSDNDSVGLRTSAILKDFFRENHIQTKIFVSQIAKDPAEHFLQKERKLSEVVEIDPTPEMFLETRDNSFDFLKYLKNRKF
jgi:hypothetical protein